MLSDSLDPDQDLLSGSKLLKWYDVCCNIRGGGDFIRGDYVLNSIFYVFHIDFRR